MTLEATIVIPQVLVTLTTDGGKILAKLHSLELQGKTQTSTSIQVAQLVLKHRQNKNQKQRIVLFAGSPVEESQDELLNIAKKMRKNNIAVDVVNFLSENTLKLQAFVDSVNNQDNSHLITLESGRPLTDALIGSPIMNGNGNLNEFGIDPEMDPELAMALKLSMDEERTRQNQANPTDELDEMETDETLQQAIAMSMEVDEKGDNAEKKK